MALATMATVALPGQHPGPPGKRPSGLAGLARAPTVSEAVFTVTVRDIAAFTRLGDGLEEKRRGRRGEKERERAGVLISIEI